MKINTHLKWTFLGTIKTTNGTLKVPEEATECLIYTRDVYYDKNDCIMTSHLIKTDYDIGQHGFFGADGQIYFMYTSTTKIIKVVYRAQSDESITVWYR